MPRRLLLLATLALAACGTLSGDDNRPEYRAYWAETFNTRLGTRADIDAVIDAAAQSNANALFVQVRRRGDSWYLDSKEPLTEVAGVGEPDATGRWTLDPLRYLIDQAHARSIEIHAFVIVGAVYRDDPATKLPVDPNHVFLQHVWDRIANAPYNDERQWATRSLATSSDVSSGGYRFGTEWYLDLGHPGAAAYTVDVLAHLVAHYAVDGIHLDRIRYPEAPIDSGQPLGINVGYNPTSVARFNARHGKSGDPKSNDALWNAWRREQVTSFVRRLYITTKAIRPSVKVSAALITFGAGASASGGFANTEPYYRVFQDWNTWSEEGILDLLVPMIYKRESVAAQAAQYDDWTRFTVATAREDGRHGLIGIGAYLNTLEHTTRQARRAHDNGADGVVFYSLATTSTDRGNADFFAAMKSGPFATPVAPPALLLTTGHVAGVVENSDGAEVRIERIGSTSSRTTITDGNGWFGFAHLAPGRYRVDSCTVEVRLGEVTTVPDHCSPRRRAAR
jgi:uncharacterized lipoprotein YddW (UPF0748 family)